MHFEQQAQSSWAKTQHGLAEMTLGDVSSQGLETKRVGELSMDRVVLHFRRNADAYRPCSHVHADARWLEAGAYSGHQPAQGESPAQPQ